MKQSLIFILLLTSRTTYAQLKANISWTESSNMPAKEIIYYKPGNELTWNNFAGKPPVDNGVTAALTVSGFGYSASVKSTNGKGDLNLSIYCYFSKPKSWVKPGKNTAYILTHEQRHFDVSYIAAAIFVQKLKLANFTMANYNTLLPQIYNECCDLMNKMQNDYDGQTKNGQVTLEQQRWNALIDEKMAGVTE